MDEAGHAYHAALLKVLDALHHVTAAALGLDADFFAPYYAPSAKCSLRLAYYPPLSTTQQTSSAVRYGAHTDYTGYTILCQDDNDVGALDAGGLQVLLKSGQWAAVTPRRNAFVVNIGDLYEVWTNGRWRSTVHRVMKPPSGSTAATQPRLSIPFFTGPHDDARISCLPGMGPAKYAPVSGRAPAEEVGNIECIKILLVPTLLLDVVLPPTFLHHQHEHVEVRRREHDLAHQRF